jgi:hypothetical protein
MQECKGYTSPFRQVKAITTLEPSVKAFDSKKSKRSWKKLFLSKNAAYKKAARIGKVSERERQRDR